MKILSIYPYTHISSAAIMINGKIIAASAEKDLIELKCLLIFQLNHKLVLKRRQVRLERY